MATNFYRFLNPLVARALESEDERKRNQFADKPNVTIAPEFGGKQPNVGTIGTLYQRTPITITPPEAKQPEMDAAQLIGKLANPAAMNAAREAEYKTYQDIANAQQNLDPVAEPLRGFRDQMRQRYEQDINMPVIAEYNPQEEGFKGSLRHVGEAILYSLANAPRDPKTGEIDPLQAGIAAALTATFGGKGLHGQIARQYQQPLLDEKNARTRAQTEHLGQGLKQLSSMYPNPQENALRVLGTQLEANKSRTADAEKDYQTSLQVGLRERAEMRDEERYQRNERQQQENFDRLVANDQFSHLRTINDIQSTRAKEARTMTERVREDISAFNQQQRNRIQELQKLHAMITNIGSRLQANDYSLEEEPKLRQALTQAQSEAQALDASIKANADGFLRTVHPNIKSNFKINPNTWEIDLQPNAFDKIQQTYQGEIKSGASGSGLSDDDLILRQMQNYYRKNKR